MPRPSRVVAPPARWSLAELVESRGLAWTLLLAGALQATLLSAGWPGWPCPFQETLGLPCPGCGLSRALLALLRGDWQAAFAIHPFVFPMLASFGLVMVGALAPAPVVRSMTAALRAIEIRTRLTFILAAAFLAYGLVRLFAVAVPFVLRALV